METTTSSSGSARKHRSIQFTTFDLDSNLPRKCSTIHEIVQAQVKLRGDEIAVSCGDEKLTYRELEQRAAQLAHRLQKLGVQPESLVGIFMDRSIRTVVAILGVLKAGGAYLPIDLVYPDERVDYILKDSQAVAVITEEAHLERLTGFAGSKISLDQNFTSIAEEPATAPSVSVNATNPAYVIYTSGSTGKPKGVIVTHHNVVRLFESTDHWYGFDHRDVWTVFHSFAFDFSVWELWGALFYGGRAVVVPYLIARSPAAFYELLAREEVTVLNQTPSAFRQLIWAEENSATARQLKLRFVIFGGEALELQSLRPWFERHDADAPLLVNMYGITETTVHVTYRPILPRDIEAGLGSVIGQPIPDLTLHLLDPDQKPVAQGEPGEIYVGGEGVARGYLNRPELTSEKFVLDFISNNPGARLYRSGDLARALPNGDYEYLGRIDHQVKIHGFRIELGEIETVLNGHPHVRESAVICDDSDGDKRLVAYVVPRGQIPAISELREFTGRRLPGYMVPARIIFLEALPLTVNGKVDRRALPAPDNARPTLATTYVAPQTEQEKILAEIWETVLGISQVGVNDNFFELGGDSIRSIQVLAKAQQKGIHFSLQTLFQQPAISLLLQHLDEKGDDELEKTPSPFALVSAADKTKMPAGVVDAYPIGRLQYGMIYHSDLDEKSAIFHDVFSFRLNLPYSHDTLVQAVNRLTQRHSIFRTSFHLNEFSEPLQLIHGSVQVPFTLDDLRLSTEEEQRAQLIDWVDREKRHRFAWNQAPLMRLHVQRYSENSFQFIVSFHHAIMDGWSLAMMLTELFRDYMGLVENNDAHISVPQVTYRDFVQLEQRIAHSPISRDFWQRKIEGAQLHTLPRWPHNPVEKAREQVRGPEIYYPNTLLRALQDVARTTGVPIRTVLLAAHCRVMTLLTGQTDVLTGLVANGRPQCIDGERLIGLFLNTLPFRIQVDGSWREVIKNTFAAEQEIIPHRRMPLADIQRMAEGKSLFETTFDFVQFHIYRDLPGYKDHTFLEDHYFEANNFNFFVTFMLDASASELQLHFDYNPNEFSREQITAICDYYSETLRAIAANPDLPCLDSSLLPAREWKQLQSWNNTEAPVPNLCVHQQFENVAKSFPEKTAAVFENQRFTYSELNQKANGIARELLESGLKPEDLVGIYLNRSVEMIAAALGVLKAGGAYVPLDPNYPEERLGFMVRDSQLKYILSSSDLKEDAAELGPVSVLEVNKIAGNLANPVIPSLSTKNLAYVIYTSGSTGLPKGVQIAHHALANFLSSMQKEPGISANDKLLAVTTLSFDIAGLELWLPLISAATVVLASSEDAKDPVALSRLIATHEVSTMQATPITWSALLDSGWSGSAGLKALCGGEAMNPRLADALLQKCGEVWNMYGPTETTIWSTLSKLTPGEPSISIGRPIANTEIYILDRNLMPVPIGSDGELFIGGDGLARGYLNRPELTTEKFIPHPFKPAGFLYRTGDLARYLPDGRILCLGRTDNQVKVRGFRIELGEIESVLEQHPSVRKAVVASRDDGNDMRELVAYWIPSDASDATETDLRQHLQDKLPPHMVPGAWMQVSEFALTPNGKIDRKRLPEFVATHTNRLKPQVAPGTQYELEVADTWRSVLKVPEVGLNDDFFEVGGHSLAAMRIVGNLRSKYNVNITLANFFQEPTVQALAARVEELVKSHYAAQQEHLERAV